MKRVTLWLVGISFVLVVAGGTYAFPQQDTGFIVAVSEAAQDISYIAMIERQSRLVDILLKDPGIDGVISAVRARGVEQNVNHWPIVNKTKPVHMRDSTGNGIIHSD